MFFWLLEMGVSADHTAADSRRVGGFLGGSVEKNPPANAEDTGSIPGPGRSHMPRSNLIRASQLLSLCPKAREPQLPSPCATLCACNFHYAFRLSSFSIFSFIVFSYDQGSNRRAILGSESTDKICRPRHQWGLLSHTSYFSSQKCARGLT